MGANIAGGCGTPCRSSRVESPLTLALSPQAGRGDVKRSSRGGMYQYKYLNGFVWRTGNGCAKLKVAELAAMLATGDARCIDTARMIYDDDVARLFRQG